MSPAVSWEFFDQVCPNPARIDVDPNSGPLAWASARTISNHYAEQIRNIDNHCVEFVSKHDKPIFDYMYVVVSIARRNNNSDALAVYSATVVVYRTYGKSSSCRPS